MQDVASQLLAFMEAHNLNQATLAKAARVSQPTVSRALGRKLLRKGAARNRLFIYAQIKEVRAAGPKEQAVERLVAAFDRIWGRSDVHADAIVRIITKLADLPVRTQNKRR